MISDEESRFAISSFSLFNDGNVQNMNTPEATQQIAHMISGYWISQAVYVAAKLKIADLLAARSQSLSELAAAFGAMIPPIFLH